jgi:hypothetical protein
MKYKLIIQDRNQVLQVQIVYKIFVQDGFPLDPENTIDTFNNYKIEKL